MTWAFGRSGSETKVVRSGVMVTLLWGVVTGVGVTGPLGEWQLTAPRAKTRAVEVTDRTRIMNDSFLT